ncbi:MAG: SirB2 family protein [Comamonadaceae bacterium]|nr:SirB2 family protein [Comamonadaceae bacterium]
MMRQSPLLEARWVRIAPHVSGHAAAGERRRPGRGDAAVSLRRRIG